MEPGDKMGFPPGVAESMVSPIPILSSNSQFSFLDLSTFQKLQRLS
jgi:hypothetical protein